MVQVQSKKTVNPSTNDEIPLTYSRDEENKVGKIFIISVGREGKISMQTKQPLMNYLQKILFKGKFY